MSGFEQPRPCNLSIAQIDQVAADFAAEVGFRPGKDSVRDLVERLGGRIEVALTPDFHKVLESGSVEVRAADDFLIKLSPLTGPLRDNFTIAHELGHLVLHSGTPRGTIPIRVGRWGKNRVEWEANRFAAALLMPAKMFHAVADRHADDVASLAAHFGVSPAAAEVRLMSLGRLPKARGELAA